VAVPDSISPCLPRRATRSNERRQGVAAHILIIEDNEMSFVLADYLLRQAGYSTSRARDGTSGLRAAEENVADLILCDLDLPAMDGFQIASALRANGSWRAVPLVAFTADSTGVEQKAVLDAGFEGYISKPIDPRTFSATIAQYLAPNLRAH
jgi:CheY-like chemotaxis protein